MPRPLADPIRSPAAVARFLLTAILGLAADLSTKAVAADRLQDGRVVVAVPGWLRFEFVQNPGAVFGIAPGQRWVFLIVSVLAVLFLSYLFTTSGRRWFYQIVLGLLFAGVLGNMYDRVVFGKVRDMIHALPGWYWPAGVHRVLPFLKPDVFPYVFNVADTLLCTGVAILVVSGFFAPQEPLRPTAPAPAVGPG